MVQVCGGLALNLFRYEELELLVCGLPHLDFAELKSATRYDGGYTAEHETIKQFWDVVMGFTFEQKRSFLRFCTGTDRYAHGLDTLKPIQLYGLLVQYVWFANVVVSFHPTLFQQMLSALIHEQLVTMHSKKWSWQLRSVRSWLIRYACNTGACCTVQCWEVAAHA